MDTYTHTERGREHYVPLSFDWQLFTNPVFCCPVLSKGPAHKGRKLTSLTPPVSLPDVADVSASSWQIS